ncbi:MAG: Na(+)-translocating NADH-quinone reductase subunit A [Planctomycetota bacterium]
MPVTTIRRGLEIPIAGGLDSTDIVAGKAPTEVALLPHDSVGIKPRLLVKVGDRVKRGTPLYVDRRDEAVQYTAPAAGEVKAINRGARRRVLSVVVAVDGSDAENFGTLSVQEASRDQIKDVLCRSGLWPSLRQRPFERVAISDDTPAAIFITAADSRPLAPPVEAILAHNVEAFRIGAQAVAKLTDGKTYLCTRNGAKSDAYDVPGIERHEFGGPHPSGNAGVHINALCPVGPKRKVWHVGYQDVVAIGRLLQTGELPTEHTVAIVGPGVTKHQLVQAHRGAATAELLGDNVSVATPRVISGSVLSGEIASPGSETGYLGRYGHQLSVVEDSSPRQFLGWMGPGASKFSVTNTYIGKLIRQRFSFNTDTNGSLRAIVPIGSYERVMPMDIQATYLIKALASHDLEMAEKLGVLELAEEDIALCEFVCPSKISITTLLRDMLTRIEKEG